MLIKGRTKAAVSPAVSVALLKAQTAGGTRAVAVTGKISYEAADLSANVSPVPAEEEDEENQNQEKDNRAAHRRRCYDY